MDGTTFVWTVVATALGGIQLFFQKVVAEEKRDSAFNGLMMYGISGLMAVAVLFTMYDVPAQWTAIALFGLIAGVSHGIGNFIRIESLKYIDSLIFFPINKILGPLAAVIGGVWLFHDPLTFRAYIGIALSMTVPLLLISSAEHHRQTNLRKGLIFLLISTALTSASLLLTKQGLLYPGSIFFMLVISQVAGSISSLIILFRRTNPSVILRVLAPRDLHLGLIAGVLGFLSTFTLFNALKTGYVSLVYVIHAHYILIPIILSVWWYKEHINARKVMAVAVSSLAITLLYNA